MRRGLMKWREDELSADAVGARVALLRDGLVDRGLEAFLCYTTLVRPAAVHYLTGFTPYWSDGLLLVDAKGGSPVFVTALSKRVGKWLHGVNPTCEIMHAPRPGALIGKILVKRGIRRLAVLELDMMPGALVEDLTAASGFELVKANDLFAAIRARPSPSEIRLASQAEAIARHAFEELSADATTVGEIAGPLERVVRGQGAEECYIAVAPDLHKGSQLARHHHTSPLGEAFAARISVAYNGVWSRFTRTMRRGTPYAETHSARLQAIVSDLDLSQPVSEQLAASIKSTPISLDSWSIEAPVGTRPLLQVAANGHQGLIVAPYGVLSLSGHDGEGPFLFSGLVVPRMMQEAREAA
jgi:Xaa-Pro aminopeptidase